MSIRSLLALVACIIFVLAVAGASVAGLALIPLGLAFLAAAFVIA